jgi:hypothetical protein
MDSKFVEVYKEEKVKQLYRNLNVIHKFETPEESLREVLISESSHLTWYGSHANTKLKDILLNEARELNCDNINYTYRSHQYALQLINMCGFKLEQKNAVVHETMLAANIRASFPSVEIKYGYFQEMARLRMPPSKMISETDNVKFTSNVVSKFINPILKTMYGIILKKNKKSYIPCYEVIEDARTLFTFDEADESRPLIRSKTIQVEVDRDLILFENDAFYNSPAGIWDRQPSSVA